MSKQMAAALTAALDLHQPPVAMCFTNTLPDGLSMYSGRVPAGCQFWQHAGQSVFATAAADHSLCAIGVHTHNLERSPAQQTDLADALSAFAELGYVRAQDVPLIPVLPLQHRFVVYAPLSRTPLPPDLVLLLVKASQTLILSEATQQLESQNPPALGRPACAIVPQVVNSGRAALSLGCCGARAYLDVLTDEMAVFAIPGAKLQAYTSRIEALAQANRTLSKFHLLRRRDIAAGATPSIKDSLAASG